MDNAVLVSGVEQSDSVIHIRYLFFSRFFPHIGYRRILKSSLCHTAGPCWFTFLS